MQTTIKPINECRSCKSKNLSDVISLGKSYLSDFVKNNQKPPRYPLSLVICRNCYLLQLKHTPPASELYTEHYGYRSGINQTMQNELKGITEEIVARVDNPENKLLVIDIGANDGTLLKNYPKRYE